MFSSLVLYRHLFFPWTVNLLNHLYSWKIRMRIKGKVIIKIFYVFLYHLLWKLEHGPQMYPGISHLHQHNMERLNWISSLSPKANLSQNTSDSPLPLFPTFLSFLFIQHSMLCFVKHASLYNVKDKWFLPRVD